MNLLYTWRDVTLPTNWTGGRFSDCWGYVDSLGREYAFMGSTMGTHIWDVTNPTSPTMLNFQQGREASGNVTHRDFKTYQHYMYGVCDEGNSSLQIFDLKYLPDSVHKVYDSQHICKTAHNIFINNGRIYFCGMKDSSGNSITFRVASLANPVNPVVINDLASPPFTYVHDVCVQRDTAFLSCANDGLFIYDYTNPTSPQLIQSITSYPQQGYNHSSWVSTDGKTLVFADETHGTGLKVYDISNLGNPTLKSIFSSNLDNSNPLNSIPHNPFIVGSRVVISYYQDGAQVFDISNTSSPFNAGYYDTFPDDTDYTSGFGYGPGCWGVYPFLPSRHIIASDITYGLFVLDGTQVLSDNDIFSETNMIVYPNPAGEQISITSSDKFLNEKIKIDLYNALGDRVLSVSNYVPGIPVNISSLPSGIFLLKLSDGKSSLTKKIIKTAE